MYIGKLFNKYDINFPVENKLNIVIGNCGSGKTLTLKELANYFNEQEENVLYFPDDRIFTVDPKFAKNAISGLFVTSKLLGENPYNKYGFDKLCIEYKLNCIDEEYDNYIDSGIVQWINIVGNILANSDKEIIVIIDTPETNLDICVQNKFINNLLEFAHIKKLILCTHSPSMISKHMHNVFDITECVDIGA